MFKNLGITEILIIVVVIILLFGSRRIPELARSLGKSIGEFKKGRTDAGEDDEKDPDAKA
jgi:sec-independent protein translocase protein TatA